MDAKEALEEICRAASRVSNKWWDIREANKDAAWDDFSFYKGNGRWSAGASSDLAALDASRFGSALEACDAAAELVRERGWDADYDAPDAARTELLKAIEEVRAKIVASPAAMPAVPERSEPANADVSHRDVPSPAEPLEPLQTGPGGPYRARPRPEPPRYDDVPRLGFIFYLLVACAVLLTILFWTLPRQTPLGRYVGLVFAIPAALLYMMRVRTVIHEDRVIQGRALFARVLYLQDVRHVFDRDDATVQLTGLPNDLGSVMLIGADGTTVVIKADVPNDARREVIALALFAAVRAAKAAIASGGEYRSPDGLVGIDARDIHGFRVGLTVKRASMPIAKIAAINPGGNVVGEDGETLCIGTTTRVLIALLAERGWSV